MSTWPWWAVDSPGCGRPTTWPRPTRACASPSSSGTSSASGRRAGTGVGARRCSPPPEERLDASRGPGSGRVHAAGHGGDGRRGRTGGRGRGHRVRLRPRRDGGAGPDRGPTRERARDEVAAARDRGVDEDDLRLLSAAEASALVGATTSSVAPTPPTAPPSIPARLVRGLAEAVERRGVTIYEQTEAHGTAARRGGHRPGHRAGGHRGPGHRGLHPDPAGRGAHPGPGVLADDRHRAPARGVLGHGRTGPPGDLQPTTAT